MVVKLEENKIVQPGVSRDRLRSMCETSSTSSLFPASLFPASLFPALFPASLFPASLLFESFEHCMIAKRLLILLSSTVSRMDLIGTLHIGQDLCVIFEADKAFLRHVLQNVCMHRAVTGSTNVSKHIEHVSIDLTSATR